MPPLPLAIKPHKLWRSFTTLVHLSSKRETEGQSPFSNDDGHPFAPPSLKTRDGGTAPLFQLRPPLIHHLLFFWIPSSTPRLGCQLILPGSPLHLPTSQTLPSSPSTPQTSPAQPHSRRHFHSQAQRSDRKAASLQAYASPSGPSVFFSSMMGERGKSQVSERHPIPRPRSLRLSTAQPSTK